MLTPRLKEKATILQIRSRPFLHPTKSAPMSTQLVALFIQLALVAFMAFAAFKGYYLNGPITAFALAFVASRFGSFRVSALLGIIASRAVLGGQLST